MKRAQKNKATMNGHAKIVNGFANGHDCSAQQGVDLREEMNARTRITEPYQQSRFAPVQGSDIREPCRREFRNSRGGIFEAMKGAQKNKPKKNGHSKIVNGFANAYNCSAQQGVDIREEMNARSRISGPHEQSRFVPVQGPGREEMDRVQKPRKVRTPRNLNLYDDDVSSEDSRNRSYTSEECLDENELIANLRSTMGGGIWSNRRIEETWRAQQKSAEAKEERNPKETRDSKEVFRKNLLMRTLVNQRTEDNADSDVALNFNCQPQNVGENSCNFNLVPDPVEPDFYCRKIQNSRPDDEFLVEHVGKVTAVTARQFFINNIEPSDFEFCRKKKH